MRIDIEGLNAGYSPDKLILHDINLSIEGPGLICIIGPNGVGKSTLVKILCRILKPTSGRIMVDGEDLSKMSVKDAAKIIGYVPPFTKDYFSMTVVDTVLIGRHNHQKWKVSDRDVSLAYKVLRLVGAEQLALRKFDELSAGQHQKVAIARGIVEETPVLILDEPTSNLDVRHQVYVIEMLRALTITDDKLIIMISHDLNTAAKYADKVILMEEPGVVRDFGVPSEVITRDAVRDVYGVDCRVEQVDGNPMVILGSPLAKEETPL